MIIINNNDNDCDSFSHRDSKSNSNQNHIRNHIIKLFRNGCDIVTCL